MVDAISKVQIDYVSTGAEKAASDYARVDQAEQSLARSSLSVATVNDTQSRSFLSVQRALDSSTRSLDPATKALAAYERQQRLMTSATAQGIPVTDAHQRGLQNAKARVEELAKSIGAHTAATNLNRMQQMELMHVSKSLFDEIAAGASPFRALTVEGGRIGEIFSMGSGGVGGTLKAIGSSLASVLTPTVLLTGGLLGLGAAAIYAFANFESGQAKLAASMNGMGQRSGATLSQLNAAASAGARSGDLYTSEGVGLAAQYNRAGLAPDQTQVLISNTKAFGRLSGTDTSTAGGALASAFADPAKGLAELDKQLGFVSGRLRSTVSDLEAQGNLEEARTVAIKAFTDAMHGVADTTWGMSRTFEAVKNSFLDSMNYGGQLIDRAFFGPPKSKSPEQAALDKRNSDAAETSGNADSAVRSILPDLVRAQTATNQLALLRTTLSDPAVLDKMGVLPGQTQRAYSNLSVQSANASPPLRSKQDYEAALASADAFSVAEKAAVEARRAELAVLRDTGDLTRAQAAAQMAVNEAIAKANSDAKDRLGEARQEASYVGLSSYQRGRQQLIDSFSGYGGQFTKDAASKSDLAESMAPVAADLRSAGQVIADAIRQAAADIRGPGTTNPFGSLGTFGAGVATPSMIADAAARTGMDPRIIAAVGQKENGGRLTGGTSMLGSDGRPSSAWGFGQLTNAAASDVASAVPGFNKYDPNTAVFGSAEYLKILAGRNGGDMTKALNAYGGTPGYANDILRRATGPLTITPAANSNVAPIQSTALGTDQSVLATKLNTYDQAARLGPIQDAALTINAQNAALKVQQETLGQSATEIARVSFEQNLLNQYQKENIDVTPAMAGAIKQLGAEYADVTKRTADLQNQQKQLVGAMDSFRGAASGGLSTLLGDLQKGKTFGQAFGDVLTGLESKILSLAENSVINSLLGSQGSTNSGALGGGLSGILGSLFSSGASGSGFQGWLGFATGTDDAPGGPTLVGEQGPEIVNLPKHAQVINNSTTQGMLLPAASGGGTMHVQIINAHPTATATAKQGTGVNRNIVQVMVTDALVQSAATNDRGFQAFAKRAGTSRVG